MEGEGRRVIGGGSREEGDVVEGEGMRVREEGDVVEGEGMRVRGGR